MAKKDFYQLSQVSGDLCLDFANTAETGSRSRPQEWLDSYEDLAQWSAYVGILSGPTVVRLQHTAALQLEAAETVFFPGVASSLLYSGFVSGPCLWQ